MNQFTEMERSKIKNAYRKMENGEYVTAEEMRLAIAFEQWKAKNDAEAIAKHDAMMIEAQARIEECRKTHEAAVESLKTLSKAMVEQYERTCADV